MAQVWDLSSDDILAAHQLRGQAFFQGGYLAAAQAEFALVQKMALVLNLAVEETEINSLSLAKGRHQRDECLDFFVRRAFYIDAEGIHAAHMKSIHGICAKDHSPSEIQAWGTRPFHPQHRLKAILKDWVWVVEHENSIEVFAQLGIYEKQGRKHGYVYGLYLTPKAAYRGIGKILFEIMHEVLQSQGAIDAILESTITAQNFYLKLGFTNTGPEKTVEIGGKPVRCYPMKLDIEREACQQPHTLAKPKSNEFES